MKNVQSAYEQISNKILAVKDAYPSLRGKNNEYVFSALALKCNYYKNPALVLNEKDFEDFIVDGQYDGGVDILLSDPNSDTSDLVIAQSKYYQNIQFDDVFNALTKMAAFYKDMLAGHYEQVNEKVQERFLTLFSEIGEESKVNFVFYTSAPQNNIRKDRLTKKFKELFDDFENLDVKIFFGSDIIAEIKESESRRPTVESGKATIDEANNVLWYGDDAAIVNISAFSIKTLYAQHNINLLSRNLRYHVAGRSVDQEIEKSIALNPEAFWLKNNGLTITCDDFNIDGKIVKFKNFSIVNGGQTTYIIHKSKNVSERNDFYLPCKIVKNTGANEDEKNTFSLEIAKATNSQKAIKPVDLKANSPEQVRFSQAMREAGIFYQTKRGEAVPTAYKYAYLNSDLAEIGKLCLSAIFQMPGTSRNKPSTLYSSLYYDVIFDTNQKQIADICSQLLYIDYYFRNEFLKRFDYEHKADKRNQDKIAFAHNARTICTAFVAFASRFYFKNITDDDLGDIFSAANHEPPYPKLTEIFKDIKDISYIIPVKVFEDKPKCDEFLYKLFMSIINSGIACYTMAARYEDGLVVSNYLKKDKNYYGILSFQWNSLENDIITTFNEITKL